MLMHFVDIGKRPPVFDDAARVALELLQSPYEFDVGQLYYNVFRCSAVVIYLFLVFMCLITVKCCFIIWHRIADLLWLIRKI